MNNRIKVLIADDHAIVRAGLKTILSLAKDIEIVGEASEGKTAIRQSERLHPQVVIMDLMMPVMDGIAATAAICSTLPSTNVLILTTYGAPEEISCALEAGATGAIIKTTSNAELLKAIRSVAANRRYIAPEIQKLLLSNQECRSLSDRQTQILQSMIRGLSNADISKQFAISIDGVKFHIRTICAKLGAANRTEAVAIALRKHLLKM